MSVISNTHTAIVYDAKQSKPYTGQRGVVTIAKKDKDGNYGPHLQNTMFTSIPQLTKADIDFTDPSVQSFCIEYFLGVQNQIVGDNIKAGRHTIDGDKLSQSGIVDYLNQDSIGEKWDAVRIAGWFEDNIAEYIVATLMEKGKNDIEIDAAIVGYGKLFSDSLSTKMRIPMHKAVLLDKILKTAGDKLDAQGKRFAARVDAILNPKLDAELLDLGL
jgi:hypothetical protein